MQDLQLIGVHEDGEHLLLRGSDDERFQMPVDEALRAAVRRDRPRLGQLQIEVDGGLRPRDVQALIRAGVSSEEAASRAGWSVEKVHRYEGPILAEREHVAGLAQSARLRSPINVSAGGSTHTLSARVAERLKARDVEVTDASWDSWRNEGGPWTVVLTFAAGGRQRQASWSFDLADRTVLAVDDEARWLSEEVQVEAEGPIPAPRLRPASGRDVTVYDVEAEGGLRPATRGEHQDDPLDLMTAMRKRSTARGRRMPGGRSPAVESPRATIPAPAAEAPAVPEPEQSPSRDDLDHKPGNKPEEQPETMTERADTRTSPDPSQPAARRLDAPVETRRIEAPGVQARRLETHRSKGGRPEPKPAAALVEFADEGVTIDDSTPGKATPGQAPPGNASPGGRDKHPEAVEESADQTQSRATQKQPVRQSARKTGRPSVPAWDEIMFGSRPGVDRSSS
jgi:hypothetical protein